MMVNLITPSEQYVAGAICVGLILVMGGLLLWLLLRRRRGAGS